MQSWPKYFSLFWNLNFMPGHKRYVIVDSGYYVWINIIFLDILRHEISTFICLKKGHSSQISAYWLHCQFYIYHWIDSQGFLFLLVVLHLRFLLEFESQGFLAHQWVWGLNILGFESCLYLFSVFDFCSRFPGVWSNYWCSLLCLFQSKGL